ncbi:hypothetical protein [Basfia succiniciproducens]|uniref:hypothetical protein n=1 Tax=Basfia succiniciproducens TaxID=653940 RepID=UPI0008B0957F|nr:hypothetical protein [Basfia succiniciproducens]SEP60508.1 hypothetical protein SAMN02910415_00167 [Basfia succiniciproducens]
MAYYSIVELSNSNGIFEFNLRKCNAEPKSKINKLLSKSLTLIDQNILICLEQNKKENEIIQLVKNKIISPLFYIIERFYQSNGNIDVILNDDIPRFDSAFKLLSNKVNVYKDRSIRNEEFIRAIETAFAVSNIENNFYKTQSYLEFFYLKSSELNLNISDYNAKENLFNVIKGYDFSQVSPLVILITIFSAGHNAFFYKFMFPNGKRKASPKDKAINSFGDIRYLLLMAYLITYLEQKIHLDFRFLTGDKNLSKIINALKFKVRSYQGSFEYKIDSFDIRENLDSKLLAKNENTYSDIVAFLSNVGIIIND